MQTQNFNNKNYSCSKKSKTKNLKSILLCDNIVKPTKKKSKKNEKKVSKTQVKIYQKIEKKKPQQIVLIL